MTEDEINKAWDNVIDTILEGFELTVDNHLNEYGQRTKPKTVSINFLLH